MVDTIESEIGFKGEQVIVNGKPRDVHWGPILQGDGCKLKTFHWKNPNGESGSGCLIEIAPHGSSGVMETIKGVQTMVRKVVSGRGYFLGCDPEGNVVFKELDAESDENPIIVLSSGWVDCSIAGDEEFTVLNLNCPSFEEGATERELKPDDSRRQLPAEFWEKYRELRNAKTSEV